MTLNADHWLRSRAIAHRGLHNGSTIPENSISAFAAAIAQQHPIELDIQPLADGELAVFHDTSLQRMTGVEGTIFEQTLASLPTLKLLKTDEFIPSLNEVLAFVNGRVPILIEIKSEGEVGVLEPVLLKKLANYAGEFAIQSFNPYAVGWFAKHAPQILRGQLSSDFKRETLEGYKKFLLGNLLMNWVSKPHFIAYDLQALPNLPTTIARQVFKLPTIAWTVRNEEERVRALEYADNIIFEAISEVISEITSEAGG